MTNILIFIGYTITIGFLCDINKRLTAIEIRLNQFFYKIDYHHLDLLIKETPNNTDNPPRNSKDNI